MKTTSWVVRSVFLAAACCAAILVATMSLAADKVAYVDLERCLNESKMGKKYKAEFASEAEKIKAEIEREEEELKKLREDLEKQSMVLSETAREEKEREYNTRLDAFKEKFQNSQRELQKIDRELTRKVLKGLQSVIKDVGETQGYSLVLDRSEGGILYAPDSADITDQVIAKYDASTATE